MSPRFATGGSAGAEDLAGGRSVASANGAAPPGADQPTGVLSGASTLAASRPEIVVAAAFAGGLALAILARRLGR